MVTAMRTPDMVSYPQYEASVSNVEHAACCRWFTYNLKFVSLCSTDGFPPILFVLLHWRWRQQVCPKRFAVYTKLLSHRSCVWTWCGVFLARMYIRESHKGRGVFLDNFQEPQNFKKQNNKMAVVFG